MATRKDKIIEISSPEAEFKHMNHRKVGKPGDSKTAVDLKFEMPTEGHILKDLCGSDDVPPFWHADGTVKYLGLTSITSRGELKDCELEFGDLLHSKIKIEAVTVNKMKFNPIGGRNIVLSLRAQLEPTDDELVALSHAQGHKKQLYIRCNLGPIGAVTDDKGVLLSEGDPESTEPDADPEPSENEE